MKSKKDGFTTIECVISLVIICVSANILSTSLKDSYIFINSNKEQFEMLNIAKGKIEEIKYNIKINKLSELENSYNIENENTYKINTIIEKDRYYNQCYKVSVDISNDKKVINLKSYVLQQ